MKKRNKISLIAVTALFLALCLAGTSMAKSLYVIADIIVPVI